MKKISMVIFSFFLISVLFSEIVIYNFEKPEIEVENDYSELIYEKCRNMGNEGEPLLPFLSASVLLPQNQKLKNIKIISKSYYETVKNVTLKPASRQFPISQKVENYRVIPDKRIYNSKENYPEYIVENENTHYMNGHPIATFTICPVSYLPSRKEIKFLKEIKIQINSEISEKSQQLENFLRNDKRISDKIVNFVDNPQRLNTYNYSESERDENYDILLITDNSLLPAFDDYIDFKESTGYYVITATTEYIYNNYDGEDEQEKIRNCIIDHYTNSNIDYVILGGDSSPATPADNIIPHRGFKVLDEDDMPSDMYYSNLDGNWNNDGDNNWGEYGEMDLYAELEIGRICVDSATEIQNFTNKLIMYQNSPVVQDIEKALMIGEELNDDPWTFGGDYKDEIVQGGTYNGYTTTAISDNFNISYLYDRDMNWDKYDAFDQFNNTGINLLNHLGHSSPTYNMKMNNSDLTTSNFTNDGISRGFVIGYSQGCYNGSFDNWDFNGYYGEDCFAEKLTTLETGEVCCIANARYGWYEPGGTNSSSQYYDRQFFEAIFGQDIFQIGAVNRFSHETDVSYMENDEYMRWVAYQTNLFGDPSLDIWTAQPTDFTGIIFPSAIDIGTESISIEVNAEGARVAVCREGNLVGTGIVDESGTIEIVFDEIIFEPATLDLSIIAHNMNRFEGTIEVISGEGPYLVYSDFQIDDSAGNNNGQVDHGETIDFLVSLQNFGSETATNISAVITSENEFVNISNSSTSYEDVQPDSSAFGLTPFQIEISPLCPDAEEITFEIAIDSAEDEWNHNFMMNVHSPILLLNNVSITDENENGYLEPGENVSIDISLFNVGSGIADDISGLLYCDDEFVTISSEAAQIEQLTAGDFSNFSTPFTISISEQCPTVHSFLLNLVLNEQLGYNNLLQIEMNVGFRDNIEYGENGWLHSALNGGDDEWHQTEYRSHSTTHSWKAGGIDDSDYGNDLLCVLETPEIEITEDAYLSFYHWMQAEISSSYPGYCYDGGMVEILYDEQWQTLTPEGGYPYLSRGDNNPPYPEDTPVYSGNINWDRAFFNLDGYDGIVKFRFVFGSDGGLTMEGWYIDDITITGAEGMLSAPSELTAQSNEPSGILLNWNSPEDTPDSYYVYRRDDLFAPFEFLSETTNTNFLDSYISVGVVYYYTVSAVYPEGESPFSNTAYAVCENVMIENSDPEIHRTALYQNYPNPFTPSGAGRSPSTTISFYLNKENSADVELNIFNLKGQKVKTLVNSDLNAGEHSYVWNGRDDSGKAVSSGVYFYKLKTRDTKYTSVKKMVLMK